MFFFIGDTARAKLFNSGCTMARFGDLKGQKQCLQLRYFEIIKAFSSISITVLVIYDCILQKGLSA